MARSIYIIDGHAHMYRAFYAPFRELSSPTGEPTKAVHVFVQMIVGLITKRKPDYLAMVMDVSDSTVFRCGIYPEYKANRDATPETLEVQMGRIVDIVTAMNIPIFRQEGYEADDLLATMATRLAGEDLEVFLVSGDKDLEQLLTDKVRLFDPGKEAVLDPAGLFEKKGITPAQVIELQTLTGDNTDNVPGVPGVGVKTAAKLINQYGSAAAVVEHADELTPKLRDNIKAFAPLMPITRQLVTLNCDVPMTFDLEACRLDRLTPLAARPILVELGFTRLTEQVEALGGGAPVATPPRPARVSRVSGSDTLWGAAEEDPEAGAEVAEPPVRSGPAGVYELIDSPAKLAAFMDQLRQQTGFAFDTETTGLSPVASDLVGVSISWEAGRGYYLPVRGTMGDLLPLELLVRELRPVFEDERIAKTGHNLKYDVLALRQVGIHTSGADFDTMIASFLLEPLGRSHGLKELTRLFFGHQMSPIEDLIGKGRNQIRMDEVDTRRTAEYAGEDADFTWRLREQLEPVLRGSHAETLFRETEMPLIDVLVEMESNGIALDTALLKTLGKHLEQRMEDLTFQIHAAAGHKFNLDSPKQLGVVLFDEQGLSVIRKTKTGRSTDAETLEALAEQSNNPIPKLLLEYRELTKLKGTYVDTLPTMICQKTGRIHAHFNPIGAVTGRLSSSDPNLQNIPIRSELGRRIREAVVARDANHTLIVADYSQIELRLLAHFCQDEALVAAFKQGHDIHRAVAAQVHGVAIEAVTSAQRSAAKAVNFGIIYGQTAYGLARSLGIPVGEAKEFIEQYFARYPGIRRFIDECIEQARRTGYAQTILGRRRPIEELASRNRGQVSFGERIAVNTVVQGSAADLIKRAMIGIHRDIMGGVCPARMLIQVHDELVFEVAEAKVGRAAEQIRARMEGAMELRVPVVADVASGPNWAKAK
jgi:DNA polymerase-1